MKLFLAVSACAVVMGLASAASAQPIGTFRVEGHNPGVPNGPPAYTGVVTISQSGDIFSVVWIVGAARTRVEGRGLFTNGVFAVAFDTVQPAGPALVAYTRQGNNWVGRWITPTGLPPGEEVLTPQAAAPH
jgi:hypothetical protein